MCDAARGAARVSWLTSVPSSYCHALADEGPVPLLEPLPPTE